MAINRVSQSLIRLPKLFPAYLSCKSFHLEVPRGAIQEPVSKPVGRSSCTLIPGDGVGPELFHSVLAVFEAAGVPVDFDQFFLSELHPSISVPLDTVVENIRKNRVGIKGILTCPEVSPTGELQTLNRKLRIALDLYANVVHVKSLPGLKTKHSNVDFICVREQTEGEYSALEYESVPGIVELLKVVTEQGSTRIAKFAFDFATKYNRKKVTAIHKANIMKLGDGLFLECCRNVAKLYPNIEFTDMIIDNASMQMVSNPHQFDVLVMPNLYGSIINNIGAGLIGGAGIVGGASYSDDSVMFEPGARHTFAQGVGKNVANPTALLVCSIGMLKHMNLRYHANLIKTSLEKVIRQGKVRTKDLGGQSTTIEFTNAVIQNLT